MKTPPSLKVKAFITNRMVLTCAFVLALGAFLHFREVRVDVLDINTKAPHYVIAQIDFSFPDEAATQILKQEASREIGAIYQLNEKQVEMRRLQLEGFLIRDPSWRKKLKRTPFEKMYKGAGLIEETLLESRFADVLTLQRMEEMHFPLDNAYTFTLPSGSVLAEVPKEVWVHIKEKHLIPEGYDSAETTFLLEYFSEQNWEFQEDLSTERSLHALVQQAVPVQFTKLEAGRSIIDKGEPVTARHLTMLQAMKQALWKSRNLWQPQTVLGSILLSLLITLVGIIFVRIHHPDLLNTLSKMTLLVGIILCTLFISKVSEYYLLNKAESLVEYIRYPLIVPFATILVCLLVSSEVALFIAILLTILLGFSLAVDQDRFLIINFVGSMVALISARHLHKRKEVFSVCAKVWLSCIPVILSFSLFEHTLWNLNVMSDVVSTAAFMCLSSILIVGLLPILESLFHLTTNMTLMEYMDPNNELLRRLSLEAPGTYQHSLVVGSLAEAAARAIGANGFFCRVSTLYHDMGKLFNPHYFTENQLGGFNVHHLLTPQESAHVIMAHVSEGAELARKYRLPQSFIDIIKEHHGTTPVYYFYHKQAQQAGGDFTKINETHFRYKGPKPRTKESAIIMIADTVEAAARSMEEVSEEILSAMVSTLVDEKRNDGQLDECQLTFEELGVVKKAMVRSLLVTRHLRVKYPKETPSLSCALQT